MKMKRKNLTPLDVEVDKVMTYFADKKDTSIEKKNKKKLKRNTKIIEVDKLDTEGEDAAELKNGTSR